MHDNIDTLIAWWHIKWDTMFKLFYTIRSSAIQLEEHIMYMYFLFKY